MQEQISGRVRNDFTNDFFKKCLQLTQQIQIFDI